MENLIRLRDATLRRRLGENGRRAANYDEASVVHPDVKSAARECGRFGRARDVDQTSAVALLSNLRPFS